MINRGKNFDKIMYNTQCYFNDHLKIISCCYDIIIVSLCYLTIVGL